MSQEAKSIKAAQRLVMDRLKYSHDEADYFIRVILRNDLSILRRKDSGKFILGCTRMYLDGQLNNAMAFCQLNTAIRYVSDNRINDYDRNLNGLSCDEFIKQQSDGISKQIEESRRYVESHSFHRNREYTILQVNSYEECKKFGKYTSWCLSHLKSMYDNYSLDGINQFYIVLRDGFENVPKKRGEGYPRDDYGRSMIVLSVNVDGNLNTCTMRWDHDVRIDCDHTMTVEEISDLLGVNFYEVFKPSKRSVLFRDIIRKFKEVNNVLETDIGKYSFHIFDEKKGIYEVKQEGKYNYGENKGGKRCLVDHNGHIISDWVRYQYQVKIPQEYLDKIDPKKLHDNYEKTMREQGRYHEVLD